MNYAIKLVPTKSGDLLWQDLCVLTILANVWPTIMHFCTAKCS